MADKIDIEKMFHECSPLTRELDQLLAEKSASTDVALAAMGRLIGSRGGTDADMRNYVNIVCTFAALEMMSRKAYAEERAAGVQH